jgi:hypothetical protein
MFLLTALATLAVLSIWGIFLEKTINGLVNRLSQPRARHPPVPE